MRFSGSLVVWVVSWWVWLLVILAFPLVIWMVVFGLNPMKEYWASFWGPSIDSGGKHFHIWFGV
jgi:hypothetical protein